MSNENKKTNERNQSCLNRLVEDLLVMLSQLCTLIGRNFLKFFPQVLSVIVIGHLSTNAWTDLSIYVIGTSFGHMTGSMLGAIWIFPLKYQIVKMDSNASPTRKKQLLGIFFQRCVWLTTVLAVMPLLLCNIALPERLLHPVLKSSIAYKHSTLMFVYYNCPNLLCKIYGKIIESSVGYKERHCIGYRLIPIFHFLNHCFAYAVFILCIAKSITFQIYHIAIIISGLSFIRLLLLLCWMMYKGYGYVIVQTIPLCGSVFYWKGVKRYLAYVVECPLHDMQRAFFHIVILMTASIATNNHSPVVVIFFLVLCHQSMGCIIWTPIGSVVSEAIRVNVLEVTETREKRYALKRLLVCITMIAIPMLCLHVFIILLLFSKEISGFQRSSSHPWWLGNPLQVMFIVIEMVHIYNCFGIAFCKRTLLVFKTQYVTNTFTSNKSRPVTFQDYSISFGFYFISFFIFSCYYLVALPILCILFIELSWNEPFESWCYVVWTCILLAQGCVALYLTIHIFKKISWQNIRLNYFLPHYGSLSTFDHQRPSTPSHNISQNKSRKSIDRSLPKNESCSIELNHVANNECNLPLACRPINENISLLE